jgi:uncharacterized protein
MAEGYCVTKRRQFILLVTVSLIFFVGLRVSGAAWAQHALPRTHYDEVFSLSLTAQGIRKGGDPVEAFAKLKIMAEEGDPIAQHAVAFFYIEGPSMHRTKFVQRDDSKAVSWWRKAAVQGHISAQKAVGNSYLIGRSVAKDLDKAKYWFKKAAEQGDAGAQQSLSDLFTRTANKSTDKNAAESDDKEAFKWISKAVEQGVGMYGLGLSYAFARGTPQDVVQAYKWFSISIIVEGDSSGQVAKDREWAEKAMTCTQFIQAQGLVVEWIDKHLKANVVASLGRWLSWWWRRLWVGCF